MVVDDVLRHLSERGALEWELACLRAENAALKAASMPDSGSGTPATE
jgi:hypothetical protein